MSERHGAKATNFAVPPKFNAKVASSKAYNGACRYSLIPAKPGSAIQLRSDLSASCLPRSQHMHSSLKGFTKRFYLHHHFSIIEYNIPSLMSSKIYCKIQQNLLLLYLYITSKSMISLIFLNFSVENSKKR